ncbi:MAG: hypothetical protein Q9209_003296 [Squamulea sp. 1 TL-2023]
MVGRRFAHLTEQERLRDLKSYGTMDSGNPLRTISSRSFWQAKKAYICYLLIFLCACFTLRWILSSSKDQNTSTVAPLPPSISHQHRLGQDLQYLWMIEHNRNEQNASQATLKSLYGPMTKTSDGCATNIDAWTWSLERESYADLYLDDIFQDLEAYNAVLEADLVFCELDKLAGLPASQPSNCRVVGNSYFPHKANRVWWPSLKVFNVAANFNLAFRPQFQGTHRVKPCICQATHSGTADVTATVHKSAGSLTVTCSKLLTLRLESSVEEEDKNLPKSPWTGGDAIVDAAAPGFYMVPNRHILEHRNDKERRQLRDTIKDRDHSSNADAPRIATKTVTPRYFDQYITFALCRSVWACCCHGYLRRYEAAELSTTSFRGISPRDADHKRSFIQNHAGLFVAAGMLVLFSVLALVGALYRRRLSKTDVAAAEKPKLRLKVAKPASLNQQTIPEEPPTDEVDMHPRDARLGSFMYYVKGWRKWLADRFSQKKSQEANLDEAEEGSSPRKLQKLRGTRFEDPTELRTPFMPPALAIAAGSSNSRVLSNEQRPDNDPDGNVDHGAVEHVKGSSTAQEHESYTAAARRANRSTSLRDEHAEDS